MFDMLCIFLTQKVRSKNRKYIFSSRDFRVRARGNLSGSELKALCPEVDSRNKYRTEYLVHVKNNYIRKFTDNCPTSSYLLPSLKKEWENTFRSCEIYYEVECVNK